MANKEMRKNALAVHEVSKTALGGHNKAKVPLALPHGHGHTRSLSVPQLALLPSRHPSGLPPLKTQTSLPPPPPPHTTSRPPLPRHLSVDNAAQCCPLPVPKEKTKTTSSRLPQWPPRPPALPSKPANTTTTTTTTVCRTITHRANLPSLSSVAQEEQRRSPRPPKKSQSFGGHDRPPPVHSRPLPPLPNDRPVPGPGASLEATLGPPLPPNKPTLRGLPLPTSENTAVNSHNHNTESWEDRFTFHHVTELPQPEAYVPGPKTYPSSFVKRHPKGKRGGSPLLPPVNII
ncbi:WAS/WASL-interacting protein family member 1a [Engraulis encrasicolus]|uniref:WAS/WASL-interacting protein family member 1a n=1 Tax=Engraulis encrasicolus TaxID=184585 RepID=UPI002FD694BB